MRAIMVMFDSLNKDMLSAYGCSWTHTPNFKRLEEKSATFDTCYVGSMPCMPARRELHTGRYNFLHRSWGPIEPFDDSMPNILRENRIHSHLITDHYHYFEDGGATYHTRYRSYENFRGQEGDAWKGVVDYDKYPDSKNGRIGMLEQWFEQDIVNRSYMTQEEDQPQSKTFDAGVHFLQTNHDKDNWFLHIETFDPHEPFFSQEKYKKLYQHTYNGKLFDWPPYEKVTNQTEEEIHHLKMEYAALLSMCDHNLGKILDMMDAHDMWKDTMLIVNTDHGFMIGEHGHFAKCYFPFYEEIAHTPLFVWDPTIGTKNVHLKSLVQTIDLPATILEHFQLPLPKDMQGIPLQKVLKQDTPIREGALFGIHGGQVNVTDGRYVYMRSPKEDNAPLYQYTLMPTRHGGRRAFIDDEELKTVTLEAPFTFTKGLKTMRLKSSAVNRQHTYPTMLFDVQKDKKEEHPLQDEKIETRMKALMKKLMEQNDAPKEQFERMDLL